MKKKRIIVGLIILVAILAVAVYWFLSSSGTGGMRGGYYESETSRLGNIATYYNFTGNVAVKESQQAAAYSAATVREIYVAEGDVVAKGDALARLSDGTLLSVEIAGEETAVNASVDEAVAAGSPVIEIVNFDALEIIVKIDEYDVNAVAVGDESVPAGNYADQALSTVGCYTDPSGKTGSDITGTGGTFDGTPLDGKVNLQTSVGNVCKQAESGAVDVAFVYSSDVYRFGGVKVIGVVPNDTHKKIIYPAAVCTDSKQAEAAAEFLDWATTDADAKKLWQEWGFELVTE